MGLTDGYVTLPEAVDWLATRKLVVGRATLRAACLHGELPCERIGGGRAAIYYVQPDAALAWAQGKYARPPKRGRGRPLGTVGIKRVPKQRAASASGGAGDGE